MRSFKKNMTLAFPLLMAAALFVYIKEYNPFHKEGQNSFTETAEGIIVDASGAEYAYLCNEVSLYLKDLLPDGLIFEGSIAGEPDTLNHLGLVTPTGMYSIRGDRTFDILLRYRHDSEWYLSTAGPLWSRLRPFPALRTIPCLFLSFFLLHSVSYWTKKGMRIP